MKKNRSKLSQLILDNRTLFSIVFAALLIRGAVLILAEPWGEQVLLQDLQGFNKMGIEIEESFDFSFAADGDAISSMRTPGYPLFISLIYFFFGVQVWLVPFFQIFLDSATVVLVYFISKEIFQSKQISLISAFLYSTNILAVTSTQKLLTETLFTFVFALGVLLLVQALKQNHVWKFSLTGLVMGLATLTRPVLIYFPLIVAVVLLFTGNKPVQKIGFFVAFIFVYLLTLSPWQARNLSNHGYYSLTSIGGYSICNYNVAIVKAEVENRSTAEIKKEFLAAVKNLDNPFAKSKKLQSIAVEYILGHPVDYLRFHVKGIINMFLATSKGELMDLFGIGYEEVYRQPGSESFLDRVARNLYTPEQYFLTPFLATKNVLEYTLFLLGLVLMWKDKEYQIGWLLLFFIVFYFANVTGVIGSARYRMPMVPFYLLFSAKGIYEITKLRLVWVRGLVEKLAFLKRRLPKKQGVA